MGKTELPPDQIKIAALEIALGNPIQSIAAGSYKRVTSILYNPETGNLLIVYET